MKQEIALITLLVDDYDEAIRYYTNKLNFQLMEDIKMSEEKRWVVVSPLGSNGSRLLLAIASNELQKSRIGSQTGGRVALYLYSDDFWRDYNNMVERDVNFIESPREEEYGTVAVFEDLYGNRWDLLNQNLKEN